MSTHDTTDTLNRHKPNDKASIDQTPCQANKANENGQGITLLELFLQKPDDWRWRKTCCDIAIDSIESGQRGITDITLLGFFAYIWPDSKSKAMLLDGLVQLGIRDDVRRAFAQAVEEHIRMGQTPDASPTVPAESPPEVLMRDFESIKPQRQSWIWDDYIPEGSFTLLAGAGGVGKSLLTCLLAASISRGWPLPGSDGTPKTGRSGDGGTVIICNAEDSPEYVIRPRLDLLGADCSRIISLEGFRQFGKTDVQPITLSDVSAIEEAMSQHQPRLVILDPIQAFMGAKVDMHRSNEVRPLLRKLADLALRYNCGVLAVAHPPKGAQPRAMYAIAGSHDFSGTARSVIVMDVNPIDPAQSVVAQAKSNMGKLAPSLLLDRRGGRVSWAGTFPLSAEQLVAGERGPKATERIRCMVWLHNLLEKKGEGMNAVEIHQFAADEGYKKTMLYESRAALGIVAKRISLDLYWILPARDNPPLDNSGNSKNNRNSGNPGYKGNPSLAQDNPPPNFGNIENNGNPENFKNSEISPCSPLTPFESIFYSYSAQGFRSLGDSGDSVDSGVPGFSPGADVDEVSDRHGENEELF